MARKGRRSTNEERVEAIRLLSQGYTKAEVARILNVTESSVYGWQKAYREGGLAELSTKIASGRKRLLYQALERDEEKRRIWKEETFPAIKERAEREGARIFFADEAGCRTGHHAGTTWAPIGQTPVVKGTGKRESIGMISAVSMRGAMHWMVFGGTMDSALFTEYLDRLIHDIKGKTFLIVDRAGYHTSKETREWIKKHENRIELFFLPSYSPDLNPDEWVWKNVKHDHIARVSELNRGAA